MIDRARHRGGFTADRHRSGFPADYYENANVWAKRSIDHVVPWLLELTQPSSVVDVGCGSGAWLAACLRQGVKSGLGLDGPWVPAHSLEVPSDLLRIVDLTRPLEATSLAFDLAICLEVAHHLEPRAADTIVDTLTSLAPVVLFSASVPGQRGDHHVNEQWPAYWAAKFRARGFEAYDAVRSRLWNNPSVAWWYAQNSLLYVARGTDLGQPAARSELAGSAVDEPLPLVHPGMLAALEHLHARELEEARGLRQASRSVVAAVGRRLRAATA